MTQLKEYYNSELIPALMKEFNYKNTMQVPRLRKVLLNMGLGEAIQNIKSAYQILFQSKLNTTQALEKIESELKNSPEVSYLVDFIRRSKRGITK